MGAPKGNEFWKLRTDMSEDGKKLSREEILKLSQEYIDRCVEETINQHDIRGKFNEEVHIKKRITMNIWGLCHHLGIDVTTWRDWRKDEKYSPIITRVDNIMKSWNIEGAGCGELHPNIIARLEGLVERTDLTSDDKPIQKNIISFGGKEIEI